MLARAGARPRAWSASPTSSSAAPWRWPGLLTGQDIQRHLAAPGDLGEAVLVPAVALRDGEGVFLDDLTPADLSRALGVPVVPVEPSARALVRALRAA